MTVRLFGGQCELEGNTALEAIDEVSVVYSLSPDKQHQLRSGAIDLFGLSTADRSHRQIVLAAVSGRGGQLFYASAELQDDPEIVRAALLSARPSLAGPKHVLQHASERLRQDPEMQLLAETVAQVRKNGALLAAAPESLRGCRELAMMAVQSDSTALQLVAPELRGDPELILAALWSSSGGKALKSVFQLVPDSLRRDWHFAFAAVGACEESFAYFCDEFRGDPKIAWVARGCEAIKFASEKLRADRQFAFAMVRARPDNLEYVADDLKVDVEVVTAAVSRDGDALRHADMRLRSNADFAHSILQLLSCSRGLNRSLAFKHLSDSLRNCMELTRAAVQQDGDSLQHAGADARNDLQTVLLAVGQNGHAIQHAGAALKEHPEVIGVAITSSAAAVAHLSEAAKRSDAVIKLVVERQPSALKLLPRPAILRALAADGRLLQYVNELPWIADSDFVSTALAQNPEAVLHLGSQCPMKLRNQWLVQAVAQVPELISKFQAVDMLHCVRHDGLLLRHIPEFGKARDGVHYHHIVRAAVHQNSAAITFASERLKQDAGILRTAIRQNGGLLSIDLCRLPACLRADREIVTAAVRACGAQLQHASAELKSDMEVVVLAVQEDGLALRHAGFGPKSSYRVVSSAVRQNGMAISFAALALQLNDDIVALACDQNPLAFSVVQDTMAHIEDSMEFLAGDMECDDVPDDAMECCDCSLEYDVRSPFLGSGPCSSGVIISAK
eukprot:TRINITY_DN29221_c0_g1_i1.p1 TRINITY_DN29221_c0_g1~~TRINITY_DN29221_c0_g1_i1.p1  ORF type:complete len:731 (-),score=160.24 TRINITY_DN29221_c0_g1_i1:1-2193(-)